MICEQLQIFVEIGRRKVKGSLRIKETTEFLKTLEVVGAAKSTFDLNL